MSETNSKKLLILTTYFPPAAEIAASRLKNIIKYLLQLGWEIFVITDVDQSYDYSSDEVLCKITIYAAGRSSQGDPRAKRSFASGLSVKKAIKSFPFPDALSKHAKSAVNLLKYKRWTAKAYPLALKAIEKHGINTVLATVPRIEPLFAGAKIKKKMPSIRLVCEYRDIISANIIYRSIQSGFEYSLCERMEKAAIPFVDSFIYLTEGIKKRYMQYNLLNAAVNEGIVLTNGYDGELCRGLLSGRAPNKKLVINHIGHFYGSRSAAVFCAALARLSLEKPRIAADISLNFIGKMDLWDRAEILRICKENDLSNICVTGPVSHDQAISVMADSDVNLIITHRCGSEYALPGKIFEYIGAGRPILAVTADPLLSALMKDENLGWICANNPGDIQNCLEDIHAKWLQGGLDHIRNRNKRYEIKNIVDRLDRFLREGRSI